MEKLTAGKKVIDRVLEWLCLIILAAMALLAAGQAAAGESWFGAYSETVFRDLFVWMVMFGSAYLFSLKDRLDTAVLGARLRGAALLAAELLTGTCLLLFAGVALFYGGFILAAQQAASAGLGIPAAVICSAIPVSGAFVLFYAVYSTAAALDRFKKARSGDAKHTL